VPSYFIDLPEQANPLRWDPRDGPLPQRADTRYFGAALVAMEEHLVERDLDIYLTWNAHRLPGYGRRVVAILLGDESGQIPRYVNRVGAVFKCYGNRPTLGELRPDLLGLTALMQGGYRWLRWLPGAINHADGRRRRSIHGERGAPDPFPIPVGTYNQLDLPVRSMGERGVDVFFAGSIAHHGGRRGISSPKELARTQMLEAVHALVQTRPGVRAEVRTTARFTESAAASATDYSHALMNAKVCLAPRGTSLETFRVLEGLRYGCLVVAESLPQNRFYDNAPLLRLTRWNRLSSLLSTVLDDPLALQDWHERALAWWRERCSEAAVGQYLARSLNGLELGDD
jgi:hypothetical protein